MGDDNGLPIVDTVVWRSVDSFISVTPDDAICISVAGASFVLPIAVWHQLGKWYFTITANEQKKVQDAR